MSGRDQTPQRSCVTNRATHQSRRRIPDEQSRGPALQPRLNDDAAWRLVRHPDRQLRAERTEIELQSHQSPSHRPNRTIARIPAHRRRPTTAWRVEIARRQSAEVPERSQRARQYRLALPKMILQRPECGHPESPRKAFRSPPAVVQSARLFSSTRQRRVCFRYQRKATSLRSSRQDQPRRVYRQPESDRLVRRLQLPRRSRVSRCKLE